MIAEVSLSGAGTVAVATQDRRDYIKSGETDPAYDGQGRNNWGVPEHQFTEGKLPLAGEMNKALARTLQRGGFRPVQVATTPHTNEKALTASLLASRPARAVILTISKYMWDRVHPVELSHGYRIECDLTLSVLDGQGAKIASARVTDAAKLSVIWVETREGARHFFRSKLTYLLNDAEIAAALSGKTPTPPAAASPAAAPAAADPAAQAPPLPGAAPAPAPAAAEPAGEPPPLPAATTTPAPADAKKPSLEQRLTQLDRLYKKGLISRKEYKKKKKELLDSL